MDIKLNDFIYDLPRDRIAKHPSKNRGASKLLFYNKGNISHHLFEHIDKLLPSDSLLVFNDTKVIPARIIMKNASGAVIELLLLEPTHPSNLHEEVMNATASCQWKCMIGNAKKWGKGSSLYISLPFMEAIRVSNNEVRFNWSNGLSFANVLTQIGQIPLPPYINRNVSKEDQNRYQTVFSKKKGAVAAPTAGLHFTRNTIEQIERKSIITDYLTLHVSAGTFQPIKSKNILDHSIHYEYIQISKKPIENLLSAKKTIVVGTTTMRTIESVYWYGVKIMKGDQHFIINQNDSYQLPPIPKEQALEMVLKKMEQEGVDKIRGQTGIFIYPGYDFKICDGLVTNYHMPGSSLILLVAAFVGADWREIYTSALSNHYQFLSYGDSSLLIK